MVKNGPFDQQWELMSLQDSLLPPLKPHTRKIGGLLKTNRPRGPLQFIRRFRYSIESPTNRLKTPLDRQKGSLKRRGAHVTKRRSLGNLRCGVAIADFLGTQGVYDRSGNFLKCYISVTICSWELKPYEHKLQASLQASS